MGLFKKKYAPLREAPDSWSVAQGSMNGDPLILRYLAWAEENAGHADYPYQVGVALPVTGEYAPRTAPGQERLGRFEDDLAAALQSQVNSALEAVQVAAVTTPAMREYVFYTSNPEATEGKIEALAAKNKDLVVQHIIQHDPKWKVFKELLP